MFANHFVSLHLCPRYETLKLEHIRLQAEHTDQERNFEIQLSQEQEKRAETEQLLVELQSTAIAPAAGLSNAAQNSQEIEALQSQFAEEKQHIADAHQAEITALQTVHNEALRTVQRNHESHLSQLQHPSDQYVDEQLGCVAALFCGSLRREAVSSTKWFHVLAGFDVLFLIDICMVVTD